ncbi:CRISPR-associated endonuclease Cas3'' [Streptacidiphilus fuscans]|uniref:CRISPR-associated endonuclease Cas3 n=1 Tax=Streptacidiphilus fuscans TaxID=2789292 RepID=A0A931B8J2_9ACTN|nr:CRISPR-associated endonuclease Cas3'' [Streptacidiphilus fuscans]MBF9071467.1 CRISPR-associated endonuclease Cas3'' [Streptacidiphilus fuscans]
MSETTVDFARFLTVATGHAPYPYQAALAAEPLAPLPERLAAPPGGGAEAVVLAWLYRRLIADPQGTPRRLVHVLPEGTLAGGTYATVARWLERLGTLDGPDGGALGGADGVGLHLLTGAMARDGSWRRAPERTAILIGTQEVLLSRALLRGFADGSTMTGASFALLHNDTHWVLDEPTLLGPGTGTALALQELREHLGTSAPTGTTLLSAALSDRSCLVRRVDAQDADSLAATLDAAHTAGTQTLAVLDSLTRARALVRALRAQDADREVLFAHPFRREPELRQLAEALGQSVVDRIVVAVGHALDLGWELPARTIYTELAPWAAVVRRTGQLADGARELLWSPNPDATSEPDVVEWLAEHDGQTVSLRDLHDLQEAQASRPAFSPPPPDEEDLLRLFDTAPDIDVTPWVSAGGRDPGTVLVAWRDWAEGRPGPEESDPTRQELCPVPLTELRSQLIARTRTAWIRDRQLDWAWRPVDPESAAGDLRPGVTVLLDAAEGGWSPEEGWTPDSVAAVEPLGDGTAPSRSFSCTAWVSLDQHLQETEQEARALLESLALPGLTADHRHVVTRAARYHDLGKSHDLFQDMIRSGGGDPPAGLLAKSKAPYNGGRYARPYFRHELVSALILLQDRRHIRSAEDLLPYLVAAHHGRIRVSVLPEPDEKPALLGVLDGDRTPPVELSSGERFAALVLDTGNAARLTDNALALLHRADMGPFRLAFLETLVRVADWRSSARHDGPVEVLSDGGLGV